jgi:hypothetical protein
MGRLPLATDAVSTALRGLEHAITPPVTVVILYGGRRRLTAAERS